MIKRMKEALIGRALLGINCVCGGREYSLWFINLTPLIFSLWYNQVIIDLAVGAP